MEKFFYQYRPHLCFAFAFIAFKFAPHSQFQAFCAFSLLACGSYVWFLRNRARVNHFFKTLR